MLKEDNTQRPKFWKELTTDEKVERMREVIHGLESRIRSVGNENYNLKRLLRNHEHLNNKVVMEIDTGNSCDAEVSGSLKSLNPDEVYF